MTPEMQADLAAFKAALEASTPPAQVADVVFDAIRKEQFYTLSHPEWLEASSPGPIHSSSCRAR
jgi:hypothetical protein